MADETTNGSGESSGTSFQDVGQIIGGVAAGAGMLTNWSSILRTVTGFVPHAMLFVPKITSSFTGNMMDGTSLSDMNNDILALKAVLKKKKKKDKSGGGAAGAVAKQAIAATSHAALAKELEAKGYVAMEVQYNPNTIRLTNTAGVLRNNVAAGDLAMAQSNKYGEGTYTNFTVQLIFDRVNLQDAFLTEGMTLNPSSGLELAKNIYTNATEGKYSVQKPVEGLLSLLIHEKTKSIIFYWSEMFFHGTLTSVSARYTMFNKLGHPVRAVVDLRLQQTDKRFVMQSDEEAWEDAITACFGEAGKGNLVSF